MMALAGNKGDLAEKRKVEVEVRSSDGFRRPGLLPSGVVISPGLSGHVRMLLTLSSIGSDRRPKATLKRMGCFSWRPPPRPLLTSTVRATIESWSRVFFRSSPAGTPDVSPLNGLVMCFFLRRRPRLRRALLRDCAQAAEDGSGARADRGDRPDRQGAQQSSFRVPSCSLNAAHHHTPRAGVG